MYKYLMAAALSAAVAVSAAPATARPDTGSVCTPVYTVKDYRHFASHVYAHRHITRTQRYRLVAIAACQGSPRAFALVAHWHKIYQRRHLALSCSNHYPLPCIHIAAHRYHVSEAWLINCAKSEGGIGPHDYKKPNYEHSGAAGNFQFMKGTFDSAIRAMGYSKKPWLNSKWQALAAAYMFSRGQSGQWTGKGC